MPTIEVSTVTYNRLSREATLRETTVDRLVAPLLHATSIANEHGQVAPRHLSDADFERIIQGLSRPLPPTATLPDDFSRADVYNDHD